MRHRQVRELQPVEAPWAVPRRPTLRRLRKTVGFPRHMISPFFTNRPRSDQAPTRTECPPHTNTSECVLPRAVFFGLPSTSKNFARSHLAEQKEQKIEVNT